MPTTQTPVITNQPGQAAPQGARPAGAAPGTVQPAPSPTPSRAGPSPGPAQAGQQPQAAPGQPIQPGTPGLTPNVQGARPGFAVPGALVMPGGAQSGAPQQGSPTSPNAGAGPQQDQANQQAPQSQQPPAFADVNERNEFQQFVAGSTGQYLPMFGFNLFGGAPSTYSPLDSVPVTADYVIGPGDQIVIRAWGQIDIDYTAVVDRNGAINVPRVGVLNVTGLKYQDLHGFLRTAIGRIYQNFELNVTMGSLRSIQIFVVGYAARPGTYTVSSLSTLVNAVFAAGGPSVRGSMRKIQLRRGVELVTEFDMYDLLLLGDKSKDVKLLPGDVIYFPPVGKLAAIAGSVNVQAIFEIKGESALQDLLQLAGGLTNVAQGVKALVDRIVNREVRRIEEFTLDKDGLARKLQDGDIVNIASITPRFDNAVRIQGNVAAAARLPWRQGMRVTDLLANENALIVTSYWQAQNQGQTYLGYNRREVNFDYATLQRLEKTTLVTRRYAFDLGKAIRGDARE